MPAPIRPDEMTPDDRFREIAVLLAKGVLRARKRRNPTPGPSPGKLPESAAQGLDVPRDTRLSVLTG